MSVSVSPWELDPGLLTDAPALNTLKLARGGLSERRALPLGAERATDKIGFFSDAVPGSRPMVLNDRPPAWLLIARSVYGLAATAPPLEYILYRLVGVALPGLESVDLPRKRALVKNKKRGSSQ